MNVLITSAGRRNYLVEYFRTALGGAGKVLAVDANPRAPALIDADLAFVVPPFTSPAYVPAVRELVRAHDVRLALSVHDDDALVLAEHAPALRRDGCLALVSAPETVALVSDKLALGRFCGRNGIAYPATFSSPEQARRAVASQQVGFPLVLKPRFGSASKGVSLIDGPEDIEPAVHAARSTLRRQAPGAPGLDKSQIVLQEHVAGAEYGVDVVNDPGGGYTATLARRKLEMRSGETEKAVTVREPTVEAFGRRLGTALGHVGCMDCDAIVTDAAVVLLDANPRLGGGYPFVHEAGADLPAAFLAWAEGRPADPACFEYDAGVTGMKCDRLVTTRNPVGPGGVEPLMLHE